MGASANDKTAFQSYSLWSLSWPIFIELFLATLLGTVDTLMVSRVSDDAVAVVGLSNQLFNGVNTLFVTITGGAGILVAQKLGSRKPEEARTISIIAAKFAICIGLVISAVLFLFPDQIARIIQMPEELLPLGRTYMSIAGCGIAPFALAAAFSTVIRNTGNTRGPMLTAVGINMLHVLLNYGFIFGAFGFPQLGLKGVAISTFSCRVITMLVLAYMFIHAFERRIGFADLKLRSRRLFKEVLRIGWPLGVSSSCWMLSQMVIFMFLAILGAKELAARTYMNTLESFCFMLGYAIAMGVQIQIAHLFGAKKWKEAYASAYKALFIGLAIVTVNAGLLVLLGRTFLGFFTEDPEIIRMGIALLALNMLLQPGKMLNMAFNAGLNAVGDTRYPMIIALFSMWGVAAGMSYWFGLHLGWGLVAIYCCMITDEYVRGILVFFRWRKRKLLDRAIARDTQPAHLEDVQPAELPGESTTAIPVEPARRTPAESA
ncbi:MATE family efflux transporter [Paenibacillus sacheonensis]|uniref:MATE family efflux transporter n=1 Tax=Paenibacillus sacheonensis TaxID=742054 RepID=A0A7X5C3V5_9BACL|nr:MATE family efflux transporter [Paenibacillus sacheonensis]MBM7568920.1 putative MATE family efflux protein [Paenibacillus sacheonensis]NBC72705.1 MATE family efflux transporter [Paenibacillus sacheonensis]